MICIVDYKLGNFASIHNMLRRIGVESTITDDPAVIARSSKIILPGVGAFDEGIRNLRESGIADVLTRRVMEDRVPLLGVCLGMQLLGMSSEEGSREGLGWLSMSFKRFNPPAEDRRLKTIHMGWNIVRPDEPQSELLRDLKSPARFYFVHRYYAVCDDPADVLGHTQYHVDFPSVVGRQNILGVQFHPEKSHKFGFQLYRNFAELGVKE